MFPLKLIGELIAVRIEEITGTIRLPDWKRSLSGIVIARGSQAKEVQEGDRVFFGAAVGMDSVYNGTDVRILKQDDVDFIHSDEA